MLLETNIEIIRTELARHVPSVDFREARIIGNGFRSIALDTGEGHIFLVGKHSDATATYAREYALLPSLRERISIAIPNPQWFEKSTKSLPYGFIGYEKILGRPLVADDLPLVHPGELVVGIADFFRDLHSISVLEMRYLDIPESSDFLERDASAFSSTLPILERELSREEMVAVRRWWDEYRNDPVLQEFTPVLIHGDLWYENLLVNESATQVCGVIDFESCTLHDPAKDFAPLYYLGEEFVTRVLEQYLQSMSADTARFRHRVVRHWQRRNAEFDAINYAVTHGDDEELKDSIAKLRRGPILNAAAAGTV